MRVFGRLGLALLCGVLSVVTPVAAAEADSDVRVLFDVSGSMQENDPERLGASALALLAALVPGGSRAGIWLFGETVEEALPVGEVNARWRDRALALRPRLVAYQQYTDIEAAVRAAGESAANGPRQLVLLTDGMVDLPAAADKRRRDADSRRRLLTELAPRLAEQGVVIHTIAFAGEADLALAERLAQSSGGLVARVESADGLLQAFLDILERLFPADQLPLEDGRFVVDEGVQGLSALLLRDAGEALVIVDPQGNRHRAEAAGDDLTWLAESHFDLVRIRDPLPGEWRIEGALDPASRLHLDADPVLRHAPLPATLYTGFPLTLEAWLARDGERLSPEAAATWRLRARLQGIEGEALAATELHPEGARFVGRLPGAELAGNARLVLEARRDGVRRQRVQAVNVLPAIEAEAQDDGVELVARHPGLDHANTRLEAFLLGEALAVEAGAPGRWRIEPPPIDGEAAVPLLLSAEVDWQGETLRLDLPRLLLNREARLALDAVEGPEALRGEALEGEVAEAPAPPASRTTAERIAAELGDLPADLTRGWRRYHDDPRLWGALVALLFLLVIFVAMRGARRRARRRPREEPHV
ncbi:vWA domain-containing protein [Bisbaumannia pacifica]|uniref:VWA domain-containing protein n=1 Tax=Bisbaumannia pacifica TaxID=77098 RepID=A0ABD4L5W7_9GAMM|nr:vWA domain-containing protein [Halomonas pacifica]MBH8580987.1 VWA domain-containing protein [Halomonas pacifica]